MVPRMELELLHAKSMLQAFETLSNSRYSESFLCLSSQET